MKIGFLATSLLLFVSVAAQNGLTIVYSHVNEEVPDFIDVASPARKKSASRLVCNDSMSYSYGMTGWKDPIKSNRDYGSRVLHHAAILDWRKQIIYGGSALASSPKKHFYLVDDLKKVDWIFEDSIKTILGYSCRKAFFTTNTWIQADTSFKPHVEMTSVWYAETIQLPFGPMQYYGLPGLVLEVYDQRYMGKHIRAVSITNEPVSIQIPAHIKIMTREEFRKKGN